MRRVHYGLMLGLQRPWRVETVKLDVVGKRLELELEWEREGASQDYPECGRACHLGDHAPEKQWRHLDAMGFVTTFRARVPRIKYPEHGVKSAAIPWALLHGRFTLAFDAMVIEVVKACASVHAACELLKLQWKHVHAIMERAVKRGMERRMVGGLKIDQGRAFKELFANFWEQPDKESAHIFIKKWCSRVKKTRLHALKKFAPMVERHLNGLLNYFVSRLTNALCEGFNSKIQQIKTASRGFRSFQNYRTRILFFLGDLDLSVRLSH